MVYLSTYKTGRKGDLSTLPALTKQPNMEAVMADSKVRNSIVEEQEVWKPIEGFEGLYKVSNYGRVLSLPKKRYVHHSSKPYWTKEKILKPQLRCGYPSVALHKNGQKYYVVHRLVALAFIPNPEDKPEVNHIDANKENNHVSNLEWVTRQENEDHAVKNNLKNRPIGEKQGRSKLTRKDVLDIRAAYGLGCFTQKEIADAYSVTRSNIKCVVNRISWKHI